MSIDESQVTAAVAAVIDPELRRPLGELGMVGPVQVKRKNVGVEIALPVAHYPQVDELTSRVRVAVGRIAGVGEVTVGQGLMDEEPRARLRMLLRGEPVDGGAPEGGDHGHAHGAQLGHEEGRPNRFMLPRSKTRILGIASGKGGVGKSSVTVNLAVALARRGLVVGLLDADIWGFSVPRMLGVEGRLGGAASGERKIAPHVKAMGRGRLEVVSMGLLVDDEGEALMWRGLMLNRAVQHFLEDVEWGDLDYLLIDMPPGTGDVQMGLARMLPRTEMIIVTTPAVSAQKVAIRAATMARKSYIRIVGVVENMSSFRCEHGQEYPLFGQGGGDALAHDAGVPLLGRIPIESSVAAGGDTGEPVVLGTGPAAEAFEALATLVAEEAAPPVSMAGCSARMLDAAVAALDALDQVGTAER